MKKRYSLHDKNTLAVKSKNSDNPFTRATHTCYQLLGISILSAALSSHALAQQAPYETSIASTDFDFITAEDPSLFQRLDYQGLMRREMPDNRGGGLFGDAYVFHAYYSNGTVVELAVDDEFASENAARTEAERYVTRLGKVPEKLLSGVERLVIHKGGADQSFFSDIGLLVFYSAKADKRILNNDLEESLFHESVHASLDETHARSPQWRQAQSSDNAFITEYAENNASLEDLAESAIFAYTIGLFPERFPATDQEIIRSTIPARIRYIHNIFDIDGTPPTTPGGYPGKVNIPGLIQAENYSTAPVESSAENRNTSPITQCRYYGLGVDVQDASEGTCNVGWTAAGEKLSYQLGSAGGNFDIHVRLASTQTGRRVNVVVNENFVGTVTTNGAGWQAWATDTISNVRIPNNATMTLDFVDGSTNVNYLDITRTGSSSSSSSSNSSSSSSSSSS